MTMPKKKRKNEKRRKFPNFKARIRALPDPLDDFASDSHVIFSVDP